LKNFLTVVQPEFKDALSIFNRRGARLGPVLMVFEGGFLSFESGDRTAVMRAEGEWHGRATFRPEILRAIAAVPPSMNPIPIAYAENRLLIGGMTIKCQWKLAGDSFIKELVHPSLMDLIVMERVIHRSELGSSDRGKKIRAAVRLLDRRISKASECLIDFGVKESEIRELVESKVQLLLQQNGYQ
jgi:hypothetical protein